MSTCASRNAVGFGGAGGSGGAGIPDATQQLIEGFFSGADGLHRGAAGQEAGARLGSYRGARVVVEEACTGLGEEIDLRSMDFGISVAAKDPGGKALH